MGQFMQGCIAPSFELSSVYLMLCMPKTLWLNLYFGPFYTRRIVGSSYDVPVEWNKCDVVDLYVMPCNDILLKFMMFYDYEFLDKRPNCRQPLHSKAKKCKILLLGHDGSPANPAFFSGTTATWANLKSTLFYFNLCVSDLSILVWTS